MKKKISVMTATQEFKTIDAASLNISNDLYLCSCVKAYFMLVLRLALIALRLLINALRVGVYVKCCGEINVERQTYTCKTGSIIM